MAVYADVAAFQRALKNEEIYARSQFLYRVKWATIQNTGHYPNKENLKALLFAMYAGLLPVQHVCETCHQHFFLRYRSDRCMWEWHQDKLTYAECEKHTKSLAKGTVLEGVYGKNWLNFFDAFCMWTFDCPPALIQREVGVDHKRLLQWEKFGMKVWKLICKHVWPLRISQPSRPSLPTGLAESSAAAGKKGVKRPAGAAKFNAMKQKKTANGARFCARYRHVIEVDESHLNKAKAGHLTRSGSVQADQVWVVPQSPSNLIDFYSVLWTMQKMFMKDDLAGRRNFGVHPFTQHPQEDHSGDRWLESHKGCVKAFKQEKSGEMMSYGMRWSTIAPARLSMPMGLPPITSKIDGARSSAGCQEIRWHDAATQ